MRSDELSVTPAQLKVLRHALGLDWKKRSYRNHYVTGPGCTGYSDCEALVSMKLMAKRETPPWMAEEDLTYFVTEAGRVIAERGVKG